MEVCLRRTEMERLTPARPKSVVVEDWVEREDGRLQVTVVFGPTKSVRLKGTDGERKKAEVAAAIRKALAHPPSESGRIVAHVPARLVNSFDELCRNDGVSRSRALLARVSRYVEEDGRIRTKSYPNKT